MKEQLTSLIRRKINSAEHNLTAIKDIHEVGLPNSQLLSDSKHLDSAAQEFIEMMRAGGSSDAEIFTALEMANMLPTDTAPLSTAEYGYTPTQEIDEQVEKIYQMVASLLDAGFTFEEVKAALEL